MCFLAKPGIDLVLWLIVVLALNSAAITESRADVSAALGIDVSKPGVSIPPNFYGLMTEEINHAYDGGLFAELIQNRTFQDPGRNANGVPAHWSAVGSGKLSTDKSDPVNAALPISLRLDLNGEESGVANDGYWGIPIRPDTTYIASFYAKGGDGFTGPVTASLLTDDGNITVVRTSTQPISAKWKKYTITLKTGHDAPTTAKARFVLSGRGAGSLWFSLVSLFPPTYRNTSNGLRADLMQLMAELRPKFIRLPGGNYLEGGNFNDRFNWKKMIGPADQRPGHMGCWGYRSSDGFGMPEYLLWCKQLGAEPVLALFAGYVLNGEHVNAGSPEMAVYTQEALEQIEYVSGPATSKWGKMRAADGFVEPFPLHYVEIGNEDWFDRSGSYDGRFTEMAKAIRARYPNLKIIASAPVKSFKPDMYDDHYYRSPSQLFQMATLYDMPTDPTAPVTFAGGGSSGRQPDGIKTFVGEWAAQAGSPTPNLSSALADAAFVMGLEKNSDAVLMECYAPLLVNVSPEDPLKRYPRGWQWNTNLIGYDALRSFGSPSYYAQVMLRQNKGDMVLPASLGILPSTGQKAETLHGSIGVGSWHTQVEYKDITVTAPDGRKLFAADLSKNADRWAFTGGNWRISENVISPVGPNAETWAFVGEKSWTEYTISLKARKTGGREGFIVMMHALDGDNYQWWNIGGWGNTLARCEVAKNGDRVPYGVGKPFVVETGRWYDLRLEVTGNHIKGYVDNKLVTDTTYEPQPTAASVFATATYSKADRTVIVKAVNAGAESVDMAIDLRGISRVEPNGTAIVLTGEPGSVNSLDEPLKVAPKQETLSGAASSFHRTLPAHSLTILRLKTSTR